MQAEAVEHEDAQTVRMIKRAMGWLAAVGIGAAVGLATIAMPESHLGPPLPRPDAKAQSGLRTGPGETLVAPAEDKREPSSPGSDPSGNQG